jgi:hypothetical protein
MRKYVRQVRTIQERDANNTPTVSYTRLPRHSEATAGGNDLSGTMEGLIAVALQQMTRDKSLYFRTRFLDGF